MVLSMMDQHSGGSCAMTARLPDAPPVRFSLWDLETLHVHPDSVGDAAHHEPAPVLGIAMVGDGVDIEPDIFHMRQHAAKALHHPVPVSRRTHVRAFEHAVPVQIGTIRVHHVEVRGKPPCPQNDRPGQEGVLFASLLMHCDDASDLAVFDDEVVRRHGGDPVCQTLASAYL